MKSLREILKDKEQIADILIIALAVAAILFLAFIL